MRERRLSQLLLDTRLVSAGLALAVACLGGSDVGAQELDARAYASAPVGVNFMGFGAAYSTGNILLDASLPIEDLQGDVASAVIRYSRSIRFFGVASKLKVAVPYSWGDWSAVLEDGSIPTRQVNGFGDVRVNYEILFYGAPALSPKEFASYKQKTLVGVTFGLRAPTGQYDPDRLINLGTNRWTFRTEVGVSQAVKNWRFEVAGTAWIYTDNTDFFGGQTLDQDPLYALQVHVIYIVRPGFWASLSWGYADGGTTRVDGDVSSVFNNNTRTGLTFAYPFTRRQGIGVQYSRGVTTTAGADFESYVLAYQVLWGDRK